MNMKKKFLTVIFLFSLFHTIKPQPSSSSTTKVTPASFKLALQWPNSVCTPTASGFFPCQRPVPQRFTIHGLWGFDGFGKAIPRCTKGDLLQTTDVDYKRSELEEEWPNLLGDDFAFWSQQWKRHGRCLYGMTPKSYFDTAIVVMEEVGPLLQLLRVAKGLSPDRNQAYSSNDFPAAVQNQINVITEITCKSAFNGGYQLHEVLFCASTTGALMNCSYHATNGYIAKECPGKIFFPTLAISTPTFYIALTFARAISTPLSYIALFYIALTFAMAICAPPFYIALTFALAISAPLFYIALTFVLIISTPLFYIAIMFALAISAPPFYIVLMFAFYVIVRLM